MVHGPTENWIFWVFVQALIMSPLFSSAVQAKKITLKMIYQLPWTDSCHVIFKEWHDKVNAIAPEKLHIKYLGAYEVIPTFQQMEALKKGTVDMGVIAPTFYTGLCPEAMAVQCMGSAATVPEVRKSGMMELQDKIHRAKLGVKVLGSLFAGDAHVILLRKRVDKGDLTGLKMRAIPVHLPAIKTLGGTPVSIPLQEAYTALQTGVVDGMALPANLVVDYKIGEVTSFLFYPLIPMDSYCLAHVNAKVWDGLSGDIKKIIMDKMLELESKVNAHYGAFVDKVISDLMKKGLKKCGAASPAEKQALIKKIRKAQWKTFIEDRADPAWLPKLNAIAKPVLGIE